MQVYNVCVVGRRGRSKDGRRRHRAVGSLQDVIFNDRGCRRASPRLGDMVVSDSDCPVVAEDYLIQEEDGMANDGSGEGAAVAPGHDLADGPESPRNDGRYIADHRRRGRATVAVGDDQLIYTEAP